MSEVEESRGEGREGDDEGDGEKEGPTENGDAHGDATTEKKKKKVKKRDGDKKSKKKKKDKKNAYLNRDDILEKHVGPRVRSFDANKMKNKFDKPKLAQVSNDCKKCGKQVFQMEKLVAEKATWHKNCFRCAECNCILSLETYQSHEGVLYCKVHFKALFQPKAVLEDPGEKYMSKRPKMIVLESQPEELPPDVVRSGNTNNELEELSTENLKKKFMMFEAISSTADDLDDPVSVRRSQSLRNRAHGGEDDYGVENSELGEYEYDENEEEEEEEDEDDDDENENPDQAKIRRKVKATSFSGMQDIQALKAAKKRKEMMARHRREEVAKFRQMLCAGKNINTREFFEGTNLEDYDFEKPSRKQPVKLERANDAGELRTRFESGEALFDKKHSDERKEIEEIFKEADTASRARNLFKQIDSASKDETELGGPLRRSRSTAEARKENRLSVDGRQIRNFAAEDPDEEEEKMHIECSSIQNKFKFFATYEDRVKEAEKNRKKVFRFTPPRDDEKGIDVEEQELGRDPNYVRCTDNYEDEVDCRRTKSVLAMFRKMEMQSEEDSGGRRPLKQFTPPPEGEEYSDEDEYSDDEEYTDEESESEEDEEDEDGIQRKIPKYKDEILEMVKSSQSARKAASLRAKFERWETEENRNNEYNYNEDEEEECMPSIDTARNLRAMFENKAQEASRPVTERPKMKVNRFVGGGGDKCMLCDRTVYAMERLEVAGRVLHKNCFKCCKCNTKLSMNTFSIGGEDMYCTTHYKQAFTEKGTYDVFTPNKGKWTRKIEATNSESPKNQE